MHTRRLNKLPNTMSVVDSTAAQHQINYTELFGSLHTCQVPLIRLSSTLHASLVNTEMRHGHLKDLGSVVPRILFTSRRVPDSCHSLISSTPCAAATLRGGQHRKDGRAVPKQRKQTPGKLPGGRSRHRRRLRAAVTRRFLRTWRVEASRRLRLVSIATGRARCLPAPLTPDRMVAVPHTDGDLVPDSELARLGWEAVPAEDGRPLVP